MVKFNKPNGPTYFHHSWKNVACDNVASTVVKKILFLDEDNCCSFLLFSFDYIYSDVMLTSSKELKLQLS